MTALILQATPFLGMIVPKMRAFLLQFLHALDAFAEFKVANAVPELELRRAEREINRYHRLMHASTPRVIGRKPVVRSPRRTKLSMPMR